MSNLFWLSARDFDRQVAEFQLRVAVHRPAAIHRWAFSRIAFGLGIGLNA